MGYVPPLWTADSAVAGERPSCFSFASDLQRATVRLATAILVEVEVRKQNHFSHLLMFFSPRRLFRWYEIGTVL